MSYKKQRKAFSREERKHMIIQAFLVAKTHDIEELTLTDIAHALGVTASTRLRDMVTEMEIEGAILARKDPIPGVAKFRWIYSLSRFAAGETPDDKPVQRTILIKARRGGQQALWKEIVS